MTKNSTAKFLTQNKNKNINEINANLYGTFIYILENMIYKEDYLYTRYKYLLRVHKVTNIYPTQNQKVSFFVTQFCATRLEKFPQI